MTSDADSRVILASALDHLAASIDHLAVASQALTIPPAVRDPSPPNGPPSAPAGDDTRTKMGKKVYALCAQNSWDIGDVGQRATGRNIGADSRKWSEADLKTVLDTMKNEWGVG